MNNPIRNTINLLAKFRPPKHMALYILTITLLICAGTVVANTRHRQAVPANNISSASGPTPSSSVKPNNTAQSNAPEKTSVKKDSGVTKSTVGCTKTNVVAYKTTYVDRDYLPKGETQTSGGVDGYTLLCPGLPGNESNLFPPIDKTVIVGTGQTDAEKQAAIADQQRVEEQQRELEAENERNAALLSCVRSVIAQSGGQLSQAYAQNFCQTAVPPLSSYL